MKCIIERQVPKNPLRLALQKHSAKTKENPNGHASHRIRVASEQKAPPHLEPTQPNDGKQSESWNPQLSKGQGREVMSRSGLRLVDITVGRHNVTGLPFGALIVHEFIAVLRPDFIAHPVRPIVQTHSEKVLLCYGLGHAEVVAASHVLLISVFLGHGRFP